MNGRQQEKKQGEIGGTFLQDTKMGILLCEKGELSQCFVQLG